MVQRGLRDRGAHLQEGVAAAAGSREAAGRGREDISLGSGMIGGGEGGGGPPPA